MSAPKGELPEVELPVGTLLIGDLHLDLEDEASPAPFLAWLDKAAGAPRVVILGDLFEYWIGPAQARTPGGARVLDALAAAVRAGTEIDVVPGNRDFLLDAGFERATGCRIRRDGLVGTLADGARVLVLHGDELATRDRAYQRLRRVVRSKPVLWLAPRLPHWLARRIARRLRRVSTRAVARKSGPEKALQASACRAEARRHGVQTVVCGHAHEFRDEELGDGLRWLVLDAFGGERDALVAAGDTLRPRA
ncbi:MAG: UDP-2,3-diacylglucosamine diphosphatase [Planctomycetota bacterium]|nr:UDP-2,3-diacylglucosamine diphosphatase [Planctomycetota bacterium]